MEICNRNYKLKPNFGSKKLANLLLKKRGQAVIPAELHILQPEDRQLINKVKSKLSWFTLNEYLFCFMCTDFIENIEKNLKDKYFFIIKQKNKVTAMCEATLKNKALKIEFISNIDKDKKVKGAGTSLIVKLAETAKELGENCEVIRLISLDESLKFYDKLNFQRIKNSPFYIMPRDYFNKFLSIFKPKYFTE